MVTRLRVHGHPIQPMLVTFPFGLFVCATLFDIADVAGGPALVGDVGYWTAVAALVAAGLAGAAGMVDLWDFPYGRTRRTVVTFNQVNAAMAAIFMLVCLVRAGGPPHEATGLTVAAEILALGVGAVGVRLGARLVQQFDVHTEATTFDALNSTSDTRPRPVRRST